MSALNKQNFRPKETSDFTSGKQLDKDKNIFNELNNNSQP